MHTFDFTDEDLAVLDRALAEMPFRLAAPLVQKINEQLAAAKKDESGSQDA